MFEEREYKIFDVLVDGKLREVWNRNEKHQLGEWNGCPTTWWVNLGSETVPEWHPWIDRGTNRPSWELKFKTSNYTKNKWDELQIRGAGFAEIICNTRKVYEFRFNDLGYGLSRAHQLIIEMSEHAFDFKDPEKNIGRKVWYQRQPAIVADLILDQGCAVFQYDGDGKGFDMTQPWDKDDDWESEWNGELRVKDDILSKNIWWHRK